MSLLEGAYNYVIGILPGSAVEGNAWLTANIDKIHGVFTLVLCCLVVTIAVVIGLAVLRWFGSLFNFGGRFR